MYLIGKKVNGAKFTRSQSPKASRKRQRKANGRGPATLSLGRQYEAFRQKVENGAGLKKVLK